MIFNPDSGFKDGFAGVVGDFLQKLYLAGFFVFVSDNGYVPFADYISRNGGEALDGGIQRVYISQEQKAASVS